MAEVVVIGAGLSGLAAAARLAKLGHQVTVCERNTYAGGALHVVEREGFRWDSGPQATSLPAVLRDLFRKSGRPLERYVDLQMLTPMRRHVFADGSEVDLPGGSRMGQAEALEERLGRKAARAWTDYVDEMAPQWDALRRQVLDDPEGAGRLAEPAISRALQSRVTLQRRIRRALKDERLQAMALLPFLLTGADPRAVPAYAGLIHYVERTFGLWRPAEGMAALVDALLVRLTERRVELRLSCEVAALVVDRDRIRGVQTAAGETLAAHDVVSCVDPRRLLGSLVTETGLRFNAHDGAGTDRRALLEVSEAVDAFTSARPATPPTVTHLGLRGEVPPLPAQTVFHDGPSPVVINIGGDAPSGCQAWTIWRRGGDDEDVLRTLARRGLDVAGQVVVRVDRTPEELIAETAGSPYGLAWDGWRPHVRRAAATVPLVGLHLLGASTYPGPGVPFVTWGAAQVATRIGKP